MSLLEANRDAGIRPDQRLGLVRFRSPNGTSRPWPTARRRRPEIQSSLCLGPPTRRRSRRAEVSEALAVSGLAESKVAAASAVSPGPQSFLKQTSASPYLLVPVHDMRTVRGVPKTYHKRDVSEKGTSVCGTLVCGAYRRVRVIICRNETPANHQGVNSRFSPGRNWVSERGQKNSRGEVGITWELAEK